MYEAKMRREEVGVGKRAFEISERHGGYRGYESSRNGYDKGKEHETSERNAVPRFDYVDKRKDYDHKTRDAMSDGLHDRSNRGPTLEKSSRVHRHSRLYHGEGESSDQIFAGQNARQEHERFEASAGKVASIKPNVEGLIFMCDKRQKERCLQYKVFGMPSKYEHFAKHVTPGMKLFLFEHEEKRLYGIYEAVSRYGIDLVPEAFEDAKLRFPAQVRFRIVKNCPPLREQEFREAIRDNYYDSSYKKFGFDLTYDQVRKLMTLFAPGEYRDSNDERIRYPHPEMINSKVIDKSLLDTKRLYESSIYGRSDQWRRETSDARLSEPVNGDYLQHSSTVSTKYKVHGDYTTISSGYPSGVEYPNSLVSLGYSSHPLSETLVSRGLPYSSSSIGAAAAAAAAPSLNAHHFDALGSLPKYGSYVSGRPEVGLTYAMPEFDRNHIHTDCNNWSMSLDAPSGLDDFRKYPLSNINGDSVTLSRPIDESTRGRMTDVSSADVRANIYGHGRHDASIYMDIGRQLPTIGSLDDIDSRTGRQKVYHAEDFMKQPAHLQPLLVANAKETGLATGNISPRYKVPLGYISDGNDSVPGASQKYLDSSENLVVTVKNRRSDSSDVYEEAMLRKKDVSGHSRKSTSNHGCSTMSKVRKPKKEGSSSQHSALPSIERKSRKISVFNRLGPQDNTRISPVKPRELEIRHQNRLAKAGHHENENISSSSGEIETSPYDMRDYLNKKLEHSSSQVTRVERETGRGGAALYAGNEDGDNGANYKVDFKRRRMAENVNKQDICRQSENIDNKETDYIRKRRRIVRPEILAVKDKNAAEGSKPRSDDATASRSGEPDLGGSLPTVTEEVHTMSSVSKPELAG